MDVRAARGQGEPAGACAEILNSKLKSTCRFRQTASKFEQRLMVISSHVFKLFPAAAEAA